jgi:hypothetical protein
MLNYNWVIPGGTIETGARFSACDSFALPFEGFSRSGSVHLKRRRFINGVATKNNEKEKRLC